MDWTKVRTKHYINSGLTMQQRGILVTFICLVAHLERTPTLKELNFAFASRWTKINETFTRIYQNSYETITRKVLEDCERVTNVRQHNRDRQKTYREHNAHQSQLCNAPEKRREEKRRVYKASAEPILIKEQQPNQVDLKDINLFDFTEPMKHKIFNQFIGIFKIRGWPVDPEFIKAVYKKVAESMNGVKPEKPYPYFQASLAKYLNQHSEEISVAAKRFL